MSHSPGADVPDKVPLGIDQAGGDTMRTALIQATAAAAGALVLAGCGAQTVDIGKVEDDIKSNIKEQNNVDVDVTCPDSVDWKTGESFSCDVVQDDGTKAKATVEMVNDDGEVKWSVGG
jgi:hypothetical protein